MRPATIAEVLGDQVMSRNMVPFDGNDPSLQQPGEQQVFVYATDGSDAAPTPLTPGHDPDAPPTSRGRKNSRPRHKPSQPIVHEIDQDAIAELGYDPTKCCYERGADVPYGAWFALQYATWYRSFK